MNTLKMFSFLLIKILLSSPNKIAVFKYGFYVIPGRGKEAKGGEDANYASEQLIAVADGVGGWSQHGVDPKIYSTKLI